MKHDIESYLKRLNILMVDSKITFHNKGLFLQQMHKFDQLQLISHGVPTTSRLLLLHLHDRGV